MFVWKQAASKSADSWECALICLGYTPCTNLLVWQGVKNKPRTNICRSESLKNWHIWRFHKVWNPQVGSEWRFVNTGPGEAENWHQWKCHQYASSRSTALKITGVFGEYCRIPLCFHSSLGLPHCHNHICPFRSPSSWWTPSWKTIPHIIVTSGMLFFYHWHCCDLL